ncbi:hypothetical protein HOLleu_27212 [Holothuria leucospilota]|uniref:CCHC-type domain-containing protein n=1 Tax=Holothuria leucospilota TaxID=206669 RepID=A0A9Q1BQF9_HOLLE|nr:hypothetical protein HOLleu_27212 [Holothuria leucospilota]
MALMKDGLWSIVNGTETTPQQDETQSYNKFIARRDQALAIIVLSIEPSLLHLIGDPNDPVVVWKKLADQFQKKAWANKSELRRKLYSLRLKNGDSVQTHIKKMVEIFDGLSVNGDPITEEDRVVHLLASLPDSYNMLVTALAANPEVPKMEVVTERLLHEERKMKDQVGDSVNSGQAMVMKQQTKRKGPKCYNCGKFGHIQRNCTEPAQAEKRYNSGHRNKKHVRHKANNVKTKRRDSSSDNESVGLVVRHALSANAGGPLNSWIVDSGATCHMCNDDKLFVELDSLTKSIEITLGDGHALQAAGQGVVALEMNLSNGKTKKCKLHNVLYVPNLSYNLLSVSKATESGKTTRFTEEGCQILDANQKLIAEVTRVHGRQSLLERESITEVIFQPTLTKGPDSHLSWCIVMSVAK